jgi:hypothetical protein
MKKSQLRSIIGEDLKRLRESSNAQRDMMKAIDQYKKGNPSFDRKKLLGMYAVMNDTDKDAVVMKLYRTLKTL